MINVNSSVQGHLGGSVGEASNVGSGHDLIVCEFEPHVGLCAEIGRASCRERVYVLV